MHVVAIIADNNVLIYLCSFIFELFGKSNLTFETKVMTCDIIDKLITFLTNEGSTTLSLSLSLSVCLSLSI